jgi:hypothetical protein
LAAVTLDDAPAQGQAESATLDVAVARVVHPVKRLEDEGQRLGGQAESNV